MPLAPPGLLGPYTPTRARNEPHTPTTRHRRLDSKDLINEGGEATLEDWLATVWAQLNIPKAKRREQIVSRARGIVADYVESQGKHEEVMGAAYNNILLATAMQVAHTYVKRRKEKASQQSTPMSGFE